jgi:hypothetical protein
MSKIQEKLDSLQPYVVGIRYLHGMQIVDAVFKEGWSVPTSDTIKKEFVDETQNYYMFYTEKEGITIDDLLEYVEGIIDVNIEREKKYVLLKSKVEELKKLFKEKSLNELEELKFSFNKPGVMPSLSDMDNFDLKDGVVEETVKKDNKPMVEPTKDTQTSKKKNNLESIVEGLEGKLDSSIKHPLGQDKPSNLTNIKGQKIELPPKDKKIVVEEYEVPNVVCKCGPGDVCPACEEERMEKTY